MNNDQNTRRAIRDLMNSTVVDRDGDKVGSVGQLFLDDETGKPSWVTVNTGFFGTKETFIPLNGAQKSGDTIRVAFDKATIKDAPSSEVGDHLSPDEEDALYRHYGLPTHGGQAETSHDRRDESGPTGDHDHDGRPNVLDRDDHGHAEHDHERSGHDGQGQAMGIGAAAGLAGAARRSRMRRHDDHEQQCAPGHQQGQGGHEQGMSEFERGFRAAQQGQQPAQGMQGQAVQGQRMPAEGHQAQRSAGVTEGAQDLCDEFGDLRGGTKD